MEQSMATENKGSRDVNRMIQATKATDRQNYRKMAGKEKNYYLNSLIALAGLCVLWYFGAHALDKTFVFPYFEDVVEQLVLALTDLHVWRSVMITIRRVLVGVWYATLIGFPLGILMGYSKLVMQTLAPFINSVRQIPITSWIPLAIVWFGLGDGPTIFVIAFTAIFTIILNTVSGVQDISPDYYNAARSMGASSLAVVTDVVLPGCMSGLITGIRIAMGAAWMTVV